jgi:hypothetical protein
MNVSDERLLRIDEVIEPLRVKPGSKVHLPGDFDPAFKTAGLRRNAASSCSTRESPCSRSIRIGLPHRAAKAYSSCCKHSTPPARTGRSAM